MDKENFRSTVLDKYGASNNEKEELLVYNRNVFLSFEMGTVTLADGNFKI
jgi:hypothetical protein|tara:strand:+ start:697 stop:846 length:150 start_codon:yes stop_codon:yes gene_type:complete